MRKFHKKSRSGCSKCKIRHIKCDEERPACRQCVRAGLACSFEGTKKSDCRIVEAYPVKGDKLKEEQQSEGRRSPLFKSKPKVDVVVSHRSFPLMHLLAYENELTPTPLLSAPLLDERFSNFHMRLLHHFEHDFYHHQKKMHDNLDIFLKMYLDTAFTSSYLMDEVLAYAAAHRSLYGVADRSLCLAEAKRLQTRALTGYNSEVRTLTGKTYKSMFLFSSLLGHHTIFEASLRIHISLSSAIDSLMHSIGVHRGLIAISRTAWPMFSEQDQQLFICVCKRDCMPRPCRPDSRQECDELLARLETLATAMPSWEMETYRNTIRLLQDGFDTVYENDTHSMWAAIQDWLAALPTGYIELLRQMRPEALIILAYFAVILHHSSGHWFVGDFGMRLAQAIKNNVGPWWLIWLEWPLRVTMQ